MRRGGMIDRIWRSGYTLRAERHRETGRKGTTGSMELRAIDKSKDWACMNLTVHDSGEGFTEVKTVEYTVFCRCFQEVQMVKEL